MSDTTVNKMFLKSMTIWGAIVASAPTILDALGMGGIGGLIVDLNEPVANVLNGVVTLIGAVLVVVGRLRATVPLSLKTKKA